MGVEWLKGYTEYDSSNEVEVLPTRAYTTSSVGSNLHPYVRKDFGANHFDALDIDYTLTPKGSGSNEQQGFGLSADAETEINDYASTDLALMVHTSGPKYWLIRGYNTAYDEGGASNDLTRWLTISRSAGSDTAVCYIYSDSDRTNLFDTLSVSGYGTSTKWRYAYAVITKDFFGTYNFDLGPLDLKEASDTIENLTTYTEEDPGSDLTVEEDWVDAEEVVRGDKGYVVKDFGLSYFNALNIDFEEICTDGSNGLPLALTVNDGDGLGDPSIGTMELLVRSFSITYIQLARGQLLATDLYNFGSGMIYLTVFRSADSGTVLMYVYSDAARTVLEDTLSISGFETSTKWRYLYAPSIWYDWNHTATFTGYSGNYDLNESEEPEPGSYVQQIIVIS